MPTHMCRNCYAQFLSRILTWGLLPAIGVGYVSPAIGSAEPAAAQPTESRAATPGGTVMAESAAKHAIDLEQSLNRALAHNRNLLAAALTVSNRKLDVVRRKNDFAFQLRPSGNLSRSSDADSLGYGMTLSRKLAWGTEVSASGIYRRDVGSDESVDETMRTVLEISQPLFRNAGSLLHLEPIRAAEVSVAAARRALESGKADLVLRVVETYEMLLSAQSRIGNARRALARSEKLHELTKAREVQGRERRVDTLRVGLQLGEAQLRLENSLETLAAMEDDFADLLGYTRTVEFDLAPSSLLTVRIPEPAEAVQSALSNRMDYAQVLQNYRDAERGVRISRRALWPDLRLRTRYETVGGENDTDLFSVEREDWFVGMSLGSDLNRRAEKAAHEQSVLTLQDARLDIEDRVFLIAREVGQQIRAYRRACAELRISLRNTELALQRMELADSLFRLGRGDNVSVTDAEEAIQIAEETELLARAESSISAYRLLHSMGTLTEHPDDLRPKRWKYEN